MIGRRLFVASGLALAACRKAVGVAPEAHAEALPTSLKGAPFPIGVSAMTGHLTDPEFTAILNQNITQLTPEWEMKMEYIVQDNGALKFDAPDAIAGYARQHGMRLHGHTLVWYAYDGGPFNRLNNDKQAFAETYDEYITAVVKRYKGVTRSWDVVNEPILDDGSGLRTSTWSRMLGEREHIIRAFDVAAAADPNAVLFLNEYHLELKPVKRVQFMRLIERLLSAGCKLGGIGCQTHIDIDMERGAIGTALKELAGFGLPIHLSELDISTNMKRIDLRSIDDRLQLQADKAAEVADAFMALPEKQRFAFTLWGLRDKDSWLRGPNGTGPSDRPTLFDDQGRPKPALAALAKSFGISA